VKYAGNTLTIRETTIYKYSCNTNILHTYGVKVSIADFGPTHGMEGCNHIKEANK
jgi:hypothetical protein